MNVISLTIGETLDLLRTKKLSCEELVRTYLDRIKQTDKALNAVVHLEADRALEEAKKRDAAGSFDRALDGIPFLTKDVFCEKGVPTTACSNILREKLYVPPFESTTTQRLKSAGAISLGKVNTDEFTMGGSTETSFYGVTKNPWDNARVAGGSSGGSAAAVAADECVFALGTDTGGSIRQPAAYCGVTGLRVTYGRTSRFGAMSMASSLDTTGALSKNVEDQARILQIIAGQDPKDATTGKRDVPDYFSALKKDLKGMTIGIPKEYFGEGLDAETRRITEEAIETLVKLGAKKKEISLPHTRYAVATYYVLCPCEVSSNMARFDGIRFGHTVEKPAGLTDYYERVRSEGFSKEVKRRIMIGTYALSAGYFDAYYLKAQKVRTIICDEFKKAFSGVDLIVSPVTPSGAFAIGAHAGDPVAMYLEDAYTIPQALAGIPCLSVPCGFTEKGLPLGLQIMGPQWGEAQVLSAGYAYEQATEWGKHKQQL